MSGSLLSGETPEQSSPNLAKWALAAVVLVATAAAVGPRVLKSIDPPKSQAEPLISVLAADMESCLTDAGQHKGTGSAGSAQYGVVTCKPDASGHSYVLSATKSGVQGSLDVTVEKNSTQFHRIQGGGGPYGTISDNGTVTPGDKELTPRQYNALGKPVSAIVNSARALIPN